MAKLALVTVLFFIIAPISVRAEYVLPYPSYMPGNKLYRISRLLDVVKQVWFFGTIAQSKYHLALADKYLVEAKTLFEYKQYVLAIDALERSNIYVRNISAHITALKNEHKDTTNKEMQIHESMYAHSALLTKLKNELPVDFLWEPENSQPQYLPIQALINEAIIRRINVLQ